VPGAIACYERGRGYEGDFGFIDEVGGRGLGFGAIKAGAIKAGAIKAGAMKLVQGRTAW
jgi:hypothetical protein